MNESVTQEAPKEVLGEVLRAAVQALEQMADSHRARWIQALHLLLLMIYHRRPIDEHAEPADAVGRSVANERRRQEASSVSKTMAEVPLDRGREEGRQEARESALLEAKRDALRRVLQAKWGPAAAEWHPRIEQIADCARLDDLFGQSLQTDRLADLSWE